MTEASPRVSNFRPRGLATAAIAGLLCLGVTLPACSAQEEARADSADVAARVAGQPVTMAELEEAAAAELKQLESQRRQILERVLDLVIEQKLLAAEAEARGVTLEKLNADLEASAGEVSDADIDAWYEENSERVRQPKEQVSEQIRQFLAQQRTMSVRSEYLDGLRAKHKVRILLEPPRENVQIAGAPTKGPASAPVTIIEFSDFECPFCSRLNPTLDQVMESYGDKVRLAFRHFPLAMHPNAQKAAEASICAHDQGKFWEMHDALFANQRALSIDQLKTTAADLGLDAQRFYACLDSGTHADKVAEDLAAGQAAGVTGTPAMFINGRLVSGAVPYDQLALVIDDELARQGGDD